MNLTNNSNYEITDKIELKLENKIDYVCFYKNIELIILFSQGFSIVEDITKHYLLIKTIIIQIFLLTFCGKMVINFISIY